MSEQTLGHLRRHHRDFDAFRDAMLKSHAGRFDAVFWGIWGQYVHPALPDAPRIVDMGCGPGLLLRDLAARYEAAELVGVDIQPSMLETAQETAAAIGVRARIVAADVSRPPLDGLSDGAFDAVVISMVLHEMNLPVAGLVEAARILAPGGKVVLVDWARYPLRRYSEGTLDGGEDQILHFGEHCRYDPEDYLFLAETAGLVPDEVITRKRGARIIAVLRRA